jgi:hypothetical protein
VDGPDPWIEEGGPLWLARGARGQAALATAAAIKAATISTRGAVVGGLRRRTGSRGAKSGRKGGRLAGGRGDEG